MDDPYGSAAFHSYHIDVYGTDSGGTDTGPYLCDDYKYPPDGCLRDSYLNAFFRCDGGTDQQPE